MGGRGRNNRNRNKNQQSGFDDGLSDIEAERQRKAAQDAWDNLHPGGWARFGGSGDDFQRKDMPDLSSVFGAGGFNLVQATRFDSLGNVDYQYLPNNMNQRAPAAGGGNRPTCQPQAAKAQTNGLVLAKKSDNISANKTVKDKSNESDSNKVKEKKDPDNKQYSESEKEIIARLSANCRRTSQSFFRAFATPQDRRRFNQVTSVDAVQSTSVTLDQLIVGQQWNNMQRDLHPHKFPTSKSSSTAQSSATKPNFTFSSIPEDESLHKCLTIQDQCRPHWHPVYGADPFATVVRPWQMQPAKDQSKPKQMANWYFVTGPSQAKSKEGAFKDGVFPDRTPWKFIRSCPRLRHHEHPFHSNIESIKDLKPNFAPMFGTNTQYMLSAELNVGLALSAYPPELQHPPRTVDDFFVQNDKTPIQSDRDWTLSEDTKKYKYIISHQLAEQRCRMEAKKTKPLLKNLFSRSLKLPCPAQISTMCLVTRYLLLVPQQPNAFKQTCALTIAFVPIAALEGDIDDVTPESTVERLNMKLMSVGEGVTGPPDGWTFTAQRDYYKDGLLQGNEHGWVRWQNGKVLVGMMHNKETGDMGVAFITLDTSDHLPMITKFKLVPLRGAPGLFESDYPVRLVGHSRRSLIFRNGPAKFVAVKMLYQRMDRVPKQFEKTDFHSIDCTSEVAKFGQDHFNEQIVEKPHVSQVHVLSGGILVLRLRYVKKQVELLTRMYIEPIVKSS